MATCSRILAWEIPWTEKPGGLQSMGSQRVRHDWARTLGLKHESAVKVLLRVFVKQLRRRMYLTPNSNHLIILISDIKFSNIWGFSSYLFVVNFQFNTILVREHPLYNLKSLKIVELCFCAPQIVWLLFHKYLKKCGFCPCWVGCSIRSIRSSSLMVMRRSFIFLMIFYLLFNNLFIDSNYNCEFTYFFQFYPFFHHVFVKGLKI